MHKIKQKVHEIASNERFKSKQIILSMNIVKLAPRNTNILSFKIISFNILSFNILSMKEIGKKFKENNNLK